MTHQSHLESKITIPPLYHALLPRKNISAIINNAPLAEVICIIAPYGCGKTLAAVSWLREYNRNAAWLTLDETDNSEPSFWADLSAAVLRLTGWQGVAEDLLSENNHGEVDHPSDYSPKDFFWETISAAEKSNCDTVLVLDGLYRIHDLSLLRVIKELVSALLGHWRIILISRAEMPPVFNDLMLKRHICLITIKELSYNPEETEAFFKLNGWDVSPQTVLRIHKKTEGWPVALNVICTVSRSGSVEYGQMAHEYITGFFETEIWAYLDGKTREFLLKTSVLDRLTPAVCNAVTDMGATLPLLRWLFVNGLFIAKLNETDAYRYHRVFRSFLRQKLDASDFDKTELYQKIAWWMFERDAFELAFPYFFKAGDLYGLSRVLRIINSAVLGLDGYLELIGCITSLNVADLQNYPLIVAKMALVHFALGHITEMQRLYGLFIEWIEPGALPIPPEEYAECVWEAGWLSYLNPSEPLISARQEEWLHYAEYDPRLQHQRHILAAVYQFPSVLRGIRDLCPLLETLDDYRTNDNNTSYESFSHEVSLWRLDIAKAEYAYELENFKLSEELIKNVISEVEARSLTDLYFIAIALLVKLVRAVHNPKEVGALTARLENMIMQNKQTFLLPRFHAFELRNRLAEGIAGQTEAFEKENRGYIEKPYFYLLYRHMTLARALLSTGDYNEAAMMLGTLERLCLSYDRIMDLIEVHILQAIADFKLGNEDRARRSVSEALNIARRYRFLRIFSDDAKDLWPILALLDDKMKDDYVKNVIISCKKALTRAGIKIHRKNYNQSELTKTELKILQTLSTDMSYNELALDHGIKVSTVKSHIRSIYSKLDVSNRTAAVMAARNRELIN